MMRFLALALLLLARPVQSQVLGQGYGPATTYVAWSAEATSEALAPVGQTWVVLAADIEAPWKMYALDATMPDAFPRPRGILVTWEGLPEGLSVAGPLRQSPPKVSFDENFKLELGAFQAQAQVGQPLAAADTLSEGDYDLKAQVSFQICRDDIGLCLPPATTSVDLALTVAAGAADGAAPLFGEKDTSTVEEGATTPRFEAADGGYASARAGGMGGFLLLAIGAGLAALLTPCVFPMIPLTVSYFTKHADNRSEAVRMAGVYGLSIILTFTGLGLLMAALVGAAGAQSIAANPWVNLFIALVLIVFGLSLLGLFELRLPSGLVNFANRQSNERVGYGGVIFMGLTLTMVSFSCTAPFVGGLLAATSLGEWTYPIFGMLAFSGTFALPFILFALFPRALSALPKSGSWMNAVKVTLGFVELAAAIKFLSNVDLVWGMGMISRPLAIAFTVVLFTLTGFYLLGKLRLAHDTPLEGVGVVRLLFAILFFGTSLYMLPGLLGAPLNALDAYLPPRQGTDVSLLAALPRGGEAGFEEGWITDDIDASIAEAQATGKAIFVDFTGYTCTNCREMEANVFPRPAVADRFERDFVLLRLFTDGLEKGPDFQRYQLQLTGTVALPTYAILNPDGTLITKVSGLMDEQAFTRFLDGGVAQYGQMKIAAKAAG